MSAGLAALVTVGGASLLFGLVILGTWISDRYDAKRCAVRRMEHDALQEAIDALTPADRAWLNDVGYRPPAGIFWRCAR